MERRLKRVEYKGGKGPRQGWILARWRWGHAGAVDFGKQAQEGVTPPYPTTSDIYWSGHPKQAKSDLVGLDHPRKDTTSFKSKATKKVYVGATTDKTKRGLKNRAEQILRSNFTKHEINCMGSLYFEGSRPSSRNAAATCSSVRVTENGKITGRNHLITVKPTHTNNEEVITHELVHARRHGTGEHTYDRDTEEKETELETVARVKDPPSWGGGYYQYLRDKDSFEAKTKDRIGLTGRMSRNIKGKKALKKIREYYPQSEISKAHFSPAERVDRYFVIKVNGTTIDHHMHFEGKPTKNHVIQDLKADFGENIKVWEWKDGKKVRVV